MNNVDNARIIELLVEYFQTGNAETDQTAKKILQYSDDYDTYWKKRIHDIQAGSEWSGIRSVEAEIIVAALMRQMPSPSPIG